MTGRSASRAPVLATGLAALVVLAVLAACSPTVSPPPSAPPAEAELANVAVACGSIEPAECRFVAARILAALPEERRAPFAIQITLGSCVADPCPRSLGARSGAAVIEYPNGGQPMHARLEGPPVNPLIAFDPEIPPYSGPIAPSSPRVGGPGPVEFEVGHCGLRHIVDFDGSFWVMVGQVDVENGQALSNQERGVITLVGPNQAEYRGTADFVVRLARFPGTKRFFLCD